LFLAEIFFLQILVSYGYMFRTGTCFAQGLVSHRDLFRTETAEGQRVTAGSFFHYRLKLCECIEDWACTNALKIEVVQMH